MERRILSNQDSDILSALAAGGIGGGPLTVGKKQNLGEARFFEHDPNYVLDISGTGLASQSNGEGIFACTTGQNLTAITRETNRYAADHVSFWATTIDFSALPTGNGYIEIGPWSSDGQNGFTLRYDSTGARLRRYRGSTTPVDDVAQASWNGVPVNQVYRDNDGNFANIDYTKKHLLVFAGKWLGIASVGVYLVPEDLSSAPILIHTFRHPNRTDLSVNTPNLPIRLKIVSDTNALTATSGCWVFGNDDSEIIAFKSDSNSSTALPTTIAPFVGKYISMIHHQAIKIKLSSDTNGTLAISWSDDGNTESLPETDIDYESADGISYFVLERKAEFIKITYTPTTNPASFSLDTRLDGVPGGIPTGQLKARMGKGETVVNSKAAMFLQELGNQFVPIPGGKLTAPANGVVTAPGDTTVITVAANKKIRIYHVSFVPTTASAVDVDVLVKIGATTIYRWRTNTNGGGFMRTPKNGQGWIEGATGDDVAINLSAADSVAYNIEYELI